MIREFKIERISEDKVMAYFVVKGSQLYNVRINLKDSVVKISPMDCDCPFGSNYSQTITNKEQKKICRHLKECADLLIYLKYITNWSYSE